MKTVETVPFNFAPFLQRYQAGEWRGTIFRDVILHDVMNLIHPATLLDIGCGHGFDGVEETQIALAKASGHYIGVEPDTTITINPLVNEVHACFLEEAPIQPNSVDVAFAVMVLEHLEYPEPFWAKVREVLRPGGVFWGFTIDVRHYFSIMSLLSEKIGIKDFYLNMLHGKRGDNRYENYPTFYRSNTPHSIHRFAEHFQRCDTWTFSRVGQLDYYYPPRLRGIGRTIDRITLGLGMAGNTIIVRAVK